MDGEGKFTIDRDGRVSRGIFIDGKPVGYNYTISVNGDVRIGEMQEGMFIGKCTLYNKEKKTITNKFYEKYGSENNSEELVS